MKRFFIISVLALATGTFYACRAEAQVISIHINIDQQPAWGPTGYDYAEFYYFPELDIYFDVNRALFYWLSDRRWVSDVYLPLSYSNYDLYRMYKVVLNQVSEPWRHNRLHRRDYARFRNNHSQVAIRQAKEHRYHKARSNTRAWVAPERSSHRSQSGGSHYRDDSRKRNHERSQAQPPANRKRSGNEPEGRSSKPDVSSNKPDSRSSKPDVSSSRSNSRSSKSESKSSKSDSKRTQSDSKRTQSDKKKKAVSDRF
jgi:hypothetical protein